MNSLKTLVSSFVLYVVCISFQTVSADVLPDSSCNIGGVIPIADVAWEDGGGSPWAAANPDNLTDGMSGGWHTPPDRRVQFTLNGSWNIKEVQYFDNWGSGNLILSTTGNATASINTDHYPLGWYTQNVSLPAANTVYLSVNSQNLKIDEIQFCGTPANIATVVSCDSVPNAEVIPVTANWVGGQNGIDSGLYANPDILVDGEIDAANGNGYQSWYHYWQSAGSPQVPVSFSFPSDYDIAAIRWHDHYGQGNATFTANSQSKTLDTDRWPLSWHTTPWDISNVSQLQLTLGSNDVKFSEIAFCGSPSDGNPDTVQDEYLASAHVVDSFGQKTVADVAGPQWVSIKEYYDEYYDSADHDRKSEGMCSQDVHNSYWVMSDEQGQPPTSKDYDNDGNYEGLYPTWHPPVHAEGTGEECYFMHDHGEDPRPSVHYDVLDEVNIGVPFGFVHSKHGNHTGNERKEDHVGHKVIRQDKYILVNGNPYNNFKFFNELGIECDWLSKVHQGSHSSDALGNNLHEYFLNLSCTDDTHVRIKELVSWGYRDKAFSENCTKGWYWAGFEASGPDHDPYENGNPFVDGKREFGCIDARFSQYADGPYIDEPKMLAELWKPDGKIKAPNGGGSVTFSPYYITRNPIRYFDYQWEIRFNTTQFDTYLGFSCSFVFTDDDPTNNCLSNSDCMLNGPGLREGCTGTGGMVSSVDLCVRGSDAWIHTIEAADQGNPDVDFANGVYPGFCNTLNPGLQALWEQEIVNAPGGKDTLALSNARKNHQNNPFNGAIRGVHQKRIAVYADGSTTPNFGDDKVFCTDAFGEESDWAVDDNGRPVCPVLSILQSISPENNNWDAQNIDGSNVGAFEWNDDQEFNGFDFDVGLQSGGEASEWIIDGVSDPSRKVRSPN